MEVSGDKGRARSGFAKEGKAREQNWNHRFVGSLKAKTAQIELV